MEGLEAANDSTAHCSSSNAAYTKHEPSSAIKQVHNCHHQLTPPLDGTLRVHSYRALSLAVLSSFGQLAFGIWQDVLTHYLPQAG